MCEKCGKKPAGWYLTDLTKAWQSAARLPGKQDSKRKSFYNWQAQLEKSARYYQAQNQISIAWYSELFLMEGHSMTGKEKK